MKKKKTMRRKTMMMMTTMTSKLLPSPHDHFNLYIFLRYDLKTFTTISTYIQVKNQNLNFKYSSGQFFSLIFAHLSFAASAAPLGWL